MKKLILVLILLLAAYGISYACIVTPGVVPQVTGLPPWKRAPHYSVSNELIPRIYAPALELDQKFFPKRWQF